jgi:hypothetical protein
VNSWKRISQATARTDSLCAARRFTGITSEVSVTLKPSNLRLIAGLAAASAVFAPWNDELVSYLSNAAKVVVRDRGTGEILHSTKSYLGIEADAKAREIYEEIRILGRDAFLRGAGSRTTS